MDNTRNPGIGPLELAALGLMTGAAIHIAAWLAGPWWVEALGAPPSIVASAGAGTWPALLGTSSIAAMLVGLAICCVMTARGFGSQSMQRIVLMVAAAIFVARGLLVLPYALEGQREWRTPIGRFIVTGQWFVAGSMAVLAIGGLIGIGVFRSGSSRRNLGSAEAQVSPMIWPRSEDPKC